MSRSTRFLKACRHQNVDTTPIWLMRQAGRYMPEYRALRKRYEILELIKNPELAAKITLQPVNAFTVDAAIIFADILTPLEGMGLTVEFVSGDGPIIRNPVRSAKDVASLHSPPAEEALKFTLDAIKIASSELAGIVPLIGFAGAPFTMATYAIEGGSSRQFYYIKYFMYNAPDAWHALMTKFSIVVEDYLSAQVAAGARVLQLFDSWVGILGPADFKEYVQPYIKQVIGNLRRTCSDVPIIYFGTGTAGLLPLIKDVNADVIGLDWRVSLPESWATVGLDRAIQGNLDPMVLCAPIATMKEHVSGILDSVADRNGYIFNLGHGIYKQTPTEHVRALVDFVHEYGKR